MKKIFLLVSLFLFIAGSSLAADLSARLDATALSNGVAGVYFTDTGTGVANPQAYVLQTSHASGDRNFGSGSFATTVNYREDGTNLSTFSSAAFASGTGWTAVGD